MQWNANLCVAIIGSATHLRERLAAQVEAMGEGMQCLYDAEGATQADIVIWDGMPRDGSIPTPDQFPRNMERILCATPDQLDVGLASGFFSGAWTADCSDAQLSLWFNQTVRWVEEGKKREVMQTYLTTLIDSVPDLVWFKDLKGSHLMVNDAFGRAVGKTKDQCAGRGHYYIWDLEPDEYASGEYVCLETEEEVIRKGKTCLFDEKVLSKNGLRQFKTYKSPLMNRWGEMVGTVGIAKDVTDMQNLSQELSLVLSGIPLAALVADSSGAIVFLNDKFCDYFSISREQAQNMTYPEICQMVGVSAEEMSRKEMSEIHVQRGGTRRIIQVQQQSLHDIFNNHFGNFFLGMDVTNEYELKEKILCSAQTDFLTGLSNRRHFSQKLHEVDPDTKITIVSFDLDNFKQVNDRFGHQIGDRVLIATAQKLEEIFGQQLITRMGGDEFIVTFFGPQPMETLQEKVATFVKLLHNFFVEHMHIDFLSTSAGIAQGSIRNPGLDALLHHADTALYKAKKQGKGHVIATNE